MPDQTWLNVIELSTRVGFFRSLPEDLVRNEAPWKVWFESNMPEVEEVPDFESRLVEEPKMGAWFRLLIIRTFRLDRAQLCIKSFIKDNQLWVNVMWNLLRIRCHQYTRR